ncbi:MAG: GTP-binding protein [Nanohaloarchaea archaeon]|nr:GTP-binding protein [Candidatus Nanohaloarchaea archaeon]
MEDQIDFRRMPVIHPYKKILDKAYSAASEASTTVSAQNKLLEIRIKELKRVETANEIICDYLNKIVERTPHVNLMPQYYTEIVSLAIDKEQFKKSLGAVRWAAEKSKELSTTYKKKLKGAQARDLGRIRSEYYGRQSSVLHQIRRDFTFLEDCRARLKNLPKFKEMKTVVIAGFPNVGKSSMLKTLTGAEPNIQPYPFTTKHVRVGYIEKYVQLVDTPGLLDRSLNKRNVIELQAVLALQYLSDMILFVFDASETCGYTMVEQMSLYKEMKREFDVPFAVCFNKCDLVSGDELDKYYNKVGTNRYQVSALKNEGFSKLRDFLLADALPSKKKFYQ